MLTKDENMKILILGRNRIKMHNWGHEFWKQEIARQHDVRYYGIDYPGLIEEGCIDIRKLIDDLEFEPDVIYTHLAKDQKCGIAGFPEIKIPKVHYTTEYFHHPEHATREENYVKKSEIDLVLLPRRWQVEKMSSICSAQFLPFSVNTDVFKSEGGNRPILVSAIMTGSPARYEFYHERTEILEQVQGIEGGYAFEASYKRKLFHDKYIEKLTGAKIAVCATKLKLENEIYTFANWKFVEIPACGALLLTQSDDDLEAMGFRHYDNCVVFDRTNEITVIVANLLKDDALIQKSAEAGLALVRERHSNEIRVQQFTEIVQRELGI